jgi:hypothetical protein
MMSPQQQALLYHSSLFGAEVNPYHRMLSYVPPPNSGPGILQDHIIRLHQQAGRLGSLGSSVPIHLPSTTSVGLQQEFANPYAMAYQNVRLGDNTNAHPLLVAAQQRSALLAATLYPVQPVQLAQGDTSRRSLVRANDTLLAFRQGGVNSNTSASTATGVGGGPESFPMVLHRALADLELAEGGAEIATFLPDGKSFLIRNQFLFENRVLPVFFPKMKSFASFQRQLNLYDFKRVGGAGVNRGAYHHALFVRDNPDDVRRMKRTKLKGGAPRGPARRRRDRTSQIEQQEGYPAGDDEVPPPPEEPAEGKSEE